MLHGVRVIDCGNHIDTAFCSLLLAARGADVIAVEPPGGSPLRTLDTSGEIHRTLATGKRSVTLNAATPEGAGLLSELLGAADVLIDNDDPDFEPIVTAARASNPRLVVVSITAFGKSGPRAGWRGGDLVGWASGGLAHSTGEPDREPLQAGGHQAEHLAGLDAAAATLIAIWHASHTGEGQHVDVSRQEAVAGALESTVAHYSITGEVRTRMGSLHQVFHGLGLQQMADDRWILFGTMPTERMWEATTELIGKPAWAMEERWKDGMDRRRHADEVDALAAETLAGVDTDEIIDAMKAARLPVALVRDMAAVADAPQLRARAFFSTGAGKAFQLDGDTVLDTRPGDHNRAVLVEELGYSLNELEHWHETGIV